MGAISSQYGNGCSICAELPKCECSERYLERKKYYDKEKERNRIKSVEIHLYNQSAPVEIKNIKNAYQKGDLYCVMCQDGIVYKFPIIHIFRIKESPYE